MRKSAGKLLVIVALSIMASCDNFMDVHEAYIRGGEQIYAPKPDSIVFVAGRERIMFRFWLYNSPNVQLVNLYWNDGQDSLVIPVTPTTGLDSTDLILPDLPEKSYTFNVRTVDKYGHASLTMTDFGSSYGDIFQSSLLHRRIREVTLSDTGGEITWFAAASNLVGNQIRYETTTGQKTIVWMPANENTVLCNGAKPNSQFEYRSLFIPEEMAIDTFAVGWTTYETPF